MSWSVAAIGKSQAVAAEIAKQFANGSKCMEPEESIRQAAASLIATAMVAEDAAVVVTVTANGSQSFKDYTTKTGVTNSLSITIQPQYGFIE
jgi:hypothetical protein